MNKKVAIILVNWNSYDYTSNCIQSIYQSNAPIYDIIVVDNHSDDGSGFELAKTFKDIIFIPSKINNGFTGGNNAGIKYALNHGYEYSFILNNDTIVSPDFLMPLVEYLDHHPETGMVQPKIYFNHDRSLLWNGGSYYNKFLGLTYTSGNHFKFSHVSDQIKRVDWITGCAFLAKNSTLKEVSFFDDRFFMYYEDVDLSFRIKKAGYNLIYQPASVIYHEAGVSLKNKTKNKEGYLSPYIHYLNARNKLFFLKKHTVIYLFPGVIIFNFFHAITFIGYFVVRGRFSKLSHFTKGLRDGLFEKKV